MSEKNRRGRDAWVWAWLLALSPSLARADEYARADVAVIVDTSTSMREAGMDPERASLLVAKLLADIVPGDLAVIRLLDLADDRVLLPSRRTGQMQPCSEDPSKTCERVEPASDWAADARAKRFGVLARPRRADADFKHALEAHLQQTVNNSLFGLAFQAAWGVFEQHPRGVPRTVIWLSDGRSDNESALQGVVHEAQAAGASVEAIVFGAGDTALAQKLGIEALKVGNPAEMMRAFANAFRRIVQAPYRIDNTLAKQARFDMKRNVQEAWIVVYGDASLSSATVDGTGGLVTADYAADTWPAAGAYRMAYIKHPAAGAWTVSAKGGGAGAAYAVIQRSELAPVWVGPTQASAGAEVALAVEIRAGEVGEPVTDGDLLQGAEVTAEFEGKTVKLNDAGVDGDTQAHDGRYGGLAKFSREGEVPVRVRLRSAVADRDGGATVKVGAQFAYEGGPVELDLGTLGVDAEACRPLVFQAEQHGAVAFVLQSLKTPPTGHVLLARLPAGVLAADGGAVSAQPGDAWQVCLKTGARVASSQADGEPWLTLRVAGSQRPKQQIPVHLRWRVQGLSLWELWGWLLWWLLGGLAGLSVVLGFVLPKRLPGGLAVTFVPEREELDEQQPQPVRQWRGVGIGFYRHARAYLHPDYRLSGKPRGALAGLLAEPGGFRVVPGAGGGLFHETLDGDFEPVPPTGCRGRAGDVYRIGGHGPYFRLAIRG